MPRRGQVAADTTDDEVNVHKAVERLLSRLGERRGDINASVGDEEVAVRSLPGGFNCGFQFARESLKSRNPRRIEPKCGCLSSERFDFCDDGCAFPLR